MSRIHFSNSTAPQVRPPSSIGSGAMSELFEQFEQKWQSDGTFLAQWVADHDLGNSPGEIAELVRSDLDRRYQAGLEVDLKAYFEKFGILLNHPNLIAEIGFEDFRARKSRGLGLDSNRWRAYDAMRAASWFSQALPGSKSSHRIDKEPIGASAYAATPVVGERFGEFDLLGVLGRGAFSEVFLATQPSLASRHVALKVVRRAFDEPTHLARLQHTGIVPLYSLHRIGGYSALCMPYCGAATLADWLAPSGEQSHRDGESLIRTIRNAEVRLTERETPDSQVDNSEHRRNTTSIPRLVDGANGQLLQRLSSINSKDFPLWFARKIASALAHAHDRNVVHGDLKPANILIRVDGEPALIDFNLAKYGGEPDSNWTGGTLPYMSPEQLSKLLGRRRHISASSDVFSLGIILYEILEGHRPFEAPISAAESDLELAIERWRHPLPMISVNGSAGLKAIVSKCLAWEPGHRYSDAGQLVEDLEREASQLPLRHAPEKLLDSRIPKLLRRNPKALAFSATALAGVLLIAASSLAGVWWVRSNRLASREAIAKWSPQSANYLALDQFQSPSDYSKAIGQLDLTLRGLFGDSENPNAVNSKLGWLESAERQRAERGIAHTLAISTAMAAENVHRLDSTDRATLGRWLELGNQLDRGNSALASARYMKSLLQNSQSKFDAGDWEAMLTSVDSKSRNDADSVLLARVFVKSARPTEALKALGDVAPTEELEPLYWITIGDAHSQTLEYDLARAAYSRAILRSPLHPIPYVRRAMILERMGDFEGAANDYGVAIRLRPTSAQYYADRARTYEKLSRQSDALADLDQALHIAPDWNRLLLYRSRLRLQAGKSEEARQDYLKAMQLPPQTVEDWISRALAQLPRKPEAALSDLRAAEKLEPGRVEVLQNMAHVLSEHLHLGEEAVKAFDRLLEYHPNNQMARADRCVLLARQGKLEAALSDIAALEGGKQLLATGTVYQIGCAHSLLSKQRSESAAEAIRCVARALARGYGADIVGTDTDLDSIRALPQFQSLIEFTKLTAANEAAALSPAAK